MFHGWEARRKHQCRIGGMGLRCSLLSQCEMSQTVMQMSLGLLSPPGNYLCSDTPGRKEASYRPCHLPAAATWTLDSSRSIIS
ncbi:hypothetical protein J6590_014263 [Homalodisca vitripennis]|nr:hypothetical protein J6590_014263 [Homalodisca vitripennis]